MTDDLGPDFDMDAQDLEATDQPQNDGKTATRTQRLHKNLVKLIAQGLEKVFDQNQYSERVLEQLLGSDTRLGSQDRRFIAEHFYNLVRYFRQVEWLAAELDEPEDLDYTSLVLMWLCTRGYDLPDWPEAENIPPNQVIREAYRPEAMPTEVLQSVPDWLYAYGQTQLGDRWDAELAGLNVLAPTYLRANRLKTDVEGLLDDLVSEGVTASLVPEAPDAVMLDAKLKVIRLGSFRKGLFEVQDASSQLIAPFLAPEPGQLVIDACAGAGGKALHLAALMENQGKIIAMDVEAFKLDELKRRAKRNGVKIIHTYPIEGRKTIKQFHDKADRLLLDVPCTGLGVLRRNPDTKWKLDEESIWDLQQTQASILNQYSKMVKTGGLMVYATCSLMPAEDEDQVQKFLGEHKNWEFVKDLHTWPSEGWDGFYMALLRRNK